MTRKYRLVTAVTSLVLTAGMVTACGAGGRSADGAGDGATAEPGITEESVKIGGHFPLTGVAAPGYSEIPVGATAYFDYVNANGGVHGRQIDYLYRDDAYNPTNTSSVVNELVLQDEVFAMVGGVGTATHGAVVDFLNDEGVPDLFVSSGSLQWGDQPEDRPWTFGWQPDYEVEAKIAAQWIKENHPDARVGMFVQDDDMGRDGEAGVRRLIDDQIVAVERYTSGNTDIVPQMTNLKASGADFVIGFTVPAYSALSQLAAQRLNYDPDWFYASIGGDTQLVGQLLSEFSEGAVRDGSTMLDGAYTADYLPTTEEPDNEWTRLWQDVWAEHGAGELTNYHIYGMSYAYTFVQALEAAGPDPTRQGLVDVLEQRGGEFEGPQLAPFRYSEDSHLGISGVAISEVRGNVAEPITPTYITDIGDAPIEELDSPQPPPPANGIPDTAE
ncbi:ABC transporter substrate-binding protein [Dietzia sp. E1]|uniref:ABC transporter substrate-binding protein n=1 Tax=Dietzia sp. E1 TaxID=328361 RepID=UPI0015FD7599|nr:ABC transporter substrate-binding protein [Dietzia sp. E1]MBB1020926.1 ABC transporter substrate-binding protein [Dietzia sp. E1]